MNPYKGRPNYQFWKRAGGIDVLSSLDPVTKVSFTIGRQDPVVTAGSCFAQHVARRLSDGGFNYHVGERAHPLIPEPLARAHNYGVFSARYGNLYTARQLRQLIERAYGLRHPIETAWQLDDDSWVDPFRPQIQPGNFVSEAEVEVDCRRHLAAVRACFEEMSVFIFTLGLTEAWIDRRDESVFPLAPGVAGGTFKRKLFALKNLTANETIDDLGWALDFIRDRNPNCRFIITVSPVPLNATGEDRHVLVSTIYSKSVLRVAAEEVCNAFPMTDYFPSYEIITAPHAGGLYYASDKRTVTEAGVDHVMGLFFRHYGDDRAESATPDVDSRAEEQQRHLKEMEGVIKVLCDEESIDNR